MNENDNEKLVIELTTDEAKIAKGFSNTKAVAEVEGKKAGKSFGDNVYDSASRGLASLKSTLLGIGTALTAAFSVGVVVSAAQENEEAINRLNGALRLAGEYSPMASDGLQEYADQLSKLTTISGETIMEQTALALSLGATVGQSKQITQAAADMSAALGINFESAVSNLSRTLNGSVGTLGKMIPELKLFTKEQLESGAALDLISQKFAGFSATKTMGFSGSLAGLKNAFGELVEEVGKLITKSPVVIATFNVLSKYIDGVTNSVGKLASDKNGMNAIADSALDLGDALVTYVVAPLEQVYNIGNIAFQLLKTGLQGLVTGMATAFGGLADLANKFGIDNEFTQGIQEFRDVTQEVLVEMVDEANIAGEKIFDFNVSDKLSNFVGDVRIATEEVKNAASNVGVEISQSIAPTNLPYTFENIFEGIKSTMTKFESSVAKFSAKIGSTLMQGLGASAANAFAAFGKAVGEGDNALGAFLDSFLASMGQMAVQLGSMFILEGIALMWAGLPNGGPLIAAGAALAAFGGLMGALFSGAGGGSSGGVAVATPGTSPGNPVYTDGNDADEAPEIESARGPGVTVVVNGSIFDSDETGRRLTNLINDSFSREGIKLNPGLVR